jgi:ElaB/YqjD/DUF883 family membrane-anchored ribosome-binding protein
MAIENEPQGGMSDTGASKTENLSGESDWKSKQHDVEDEAKRTAGRAQGLAAHYAASKIDEHRDRLCHTLDNVARALESGEDELDRSDLSKLTRSAASQIRRFKDNIEQRDGEQVIGSATDMLRERPVTSIVTGLLAGFAMSRAIKATPQTTGESGGGVQGRGTTSTSATGAYGGSEGVDPVKPTATTDTELGSSTDDTVRYNAE